LDRLESVARGKGQTLTDCEKLQRLQILNATTKLNDANSNATVRKQFRKERNHKKDRLKQATNIGWRRGMELLAPTTMDTVQAKETVFGTPRQDEQSRFAKMRTSSIFSSSSVVSLLLTQFFRKARCMGLPAKSERVSVCHLEVAQASHSDAYSEGAPK
jgi:hypothetical protein